MKMPSALDHFEQKIVDVIGLPSASRSRLTMLRSSARTRLSPNCVGKVETADQRAPRDLLLRPSCGGRLSAMFMFAMTFTREITGSDWRGGGDIS
jgi:hypothetical protein